MNGPRKADEIHLPVRATVEESYQVLEACQNIEKEPAARRLVGTDCEMFGPLGIALLALALTRRRTAGHADLQLVAPHAEDARHFLDEVGFARFLTAERARENPPTGTLQMRHLFRLTPAYTQDIAGLIASRVPGTSDEVGYLIQFCLNELLQNVFEHADSKEGCFVQTRWYNKTQSVRLAVVDGGIGIPAALRRKEVANLQRLGDEDVVVAAVTRKGITSREGTKQGGLGLKLLHETATERGGKLVVISQTAKVVFRPGGPQRRRSPSLRGTAIELDFRPLAVTRAARGEEFF